MRAHRLTWLIASAAVMASSATATGTAIMARASAANTPVNAVHWDPDYNGKKITVTVDLTFFGNCPNETCAEATRIAADSVVAAILNDWNGHKYKCWPFIVKINSHVVTTVSDLPPNSVPIQLNWSPSGPVRAYTTSTGGTGNVGGLSPGDGPRPVADPDDPSVWPADGLASDYTHEFGHLLRLDDNYDHNAPTDSNGLLQARLVPGQADDAMYSANSATAHLVSEDMINQVVERSSKVDTSKVKCNMTIQSGPTDLNLIIYSITGMTAHLYTCDYSLPSNDPKHPTKPMHFKGTFSGTASVVLFGGGSASIPVEFDATIPPDGGAISFEVHSAGNTLTLSAHFTWGNDGLLHAGAAWDLNGATTAIFSPPFEGQATDGASECPQ